MLDAISRSVLRSAGVPARSPLRRFDRMSYLPNIALHWPAEFFALEPSLSMLWIPPSEVSVATPRGCVAGFVVSCFCVVLWKKPLRWRTDAQTSPVRCQRLTPSPAFTKTQNNQFCIPAIATTMHAVTFGGVDHPHGILLKAEGSGRIRVAAIVSRPIYCRCKWRRP